MRRAALLAFTPLLAAPMCDGVEGLNDLAVDLGQLERKLDRPSLTTNLEDAVYEVPELDDFDPAKEDFRPLIELPRVEGGGWALEPGLWSFTAKSFCLKPGTYGPSTASGRGHLLAPIKGPQAEVVSALMDNWSEHPDVTQQEVQSLIWAAIAKADFEDLDRRLQVVAAMLLTPEQLFTLNGGAIGLAPEPLIDSLIAKLPEPVRVVYKAEDRLRRSLSGAETSYERLEEIAVLTGTAPEEAWLRDIPEGRWNLHPDGYFIRYKPDGYSKTRQEIYLPELTAEFSFDAQGRVTRVARPDGWVTETTYVQDHTPVEVSPGVWEHRIDTVRYAEPDPENPGALREQVWTDLDAPVLVADGGAARLHLPSAAPEELRWAAPWTPRAGDEWDEGSDATNPEHYQEGLDVALHGSKQEQAEWIGKHFFELAKEVLGWHDKLHGTERDGIGETTIGGDVTYVQRLGQSNESWEGIEY